MPGPAPRSGPLGPTFFWSRLSRPGCLFCLGVSAIATPRETTLERLLAPTLESLGYDLVRVVLSGMHRPVLQIMAERRDGAPMKVTDCETISRTLSAKLDAEDLIRSAYTLEVSSPGIDRPLIRPRDYARYAGHVARVELREAQEGQRRFTGRIVSADEDRVMLALEGDGAVEKRNVAFTYGDVARAKLVLTDELLRAAGSARPAQ
jgi:ribosome maturation factor RimP